MRGVQITFFMLAIFTLSTQMVHYTYKRFNLPSTSVLDKKVDSEIVNINSLDALHKRFKKAEIAVKAFEKTKNSAELKRVNKYREQVYVTQRKLRNAIKTWEGNARKRKKMIFYWFGGLFLFMLGIAIYYFRKLWVGLSFIIAGVSEMIWWSSPSFSYTGSTSRLAHLLTTQLVLTVASMAIVLLAWIYKDGPRD